MSTIVRIPALAIKDDTTKTISTGILTVDQMYHVIAAESGAADDLDTIQLNFNALTVASITYRPILILVAASGDTITVKHGTGNIQFASSADVLLTGNDHLCLFFDGTNWNDLLNSAVSTGGDTLPVVDTTAVVKGSADATKQLRFEVDGLTTATTRVATPPDADFTMVGTATTQTLTNKTLDQLTLSDATELTIATGAITITQGYHNIDTEADAASDDLDTISGGAAGDILYIRANNAARTVVVKHGTGNIQTYDGADISLDETRKILELLHDGTNWNVVGVVGAGSGATLVSANKVHKLASNAQTTSTTFVDVDATNIAITATLTGGGKCHVTFFFNANKAAAGSAFYRLTDGITNTPEVELSTITTSHQIVVHHVFDSSAGSTTYKLQFRSSDANNARVVADLSCTMTLLEIT